VATDQAPSSRSLTLAMPAGPSPRADVGMVARRLSILPGEEVRTGLLFALLFVASTIFVMGRTARDALFLTRFPVSWIAWMWVGYGVVSSLVALGWGRIASRVARARLVIGFALGAATSYALVRVLVGADLAWAIAFFYIWAEVVPNLLIVQAWTITNDLHDPRSARRLFGLIGAGRIVGVALSGLLTSVVVKLVGTANLIVVIAVLMLVFVGLVRAIASRFPLPQAATPTTTAPSPTYDTASLRGYAGYAALLGVMLLAAFMALTVGDYQFKAIAKLSYPDRDALASYMAGFYAAMGTLALLFQLVVTPLVLRRFGIASALLTMPVAFLSSTAALLGFPGLAAATAVKLSDNGLQYTIHDATMQILYFAFPTALRTRVRAILDAMVKPLGYSLGGVLLVVLSPASGAPDLLHRVAWMGVASLAFGLVWVAVVPLVKRSYVDSLRKSLSRRQSDVGDERELPDDATVRAVLLEALRSAVPAQVLFAMDRLAITSADVLRRELPALLSSRHPQVRAEALRRAAVLAPDLALARSRQAIASGDADEQCAAFDVLGRLLADDAVDAVSPFADDAKRPALREAAIAALVAHGGLAGVVAGGSRLMDLSRSGDPRERAAAARVLGIVASPALARSLVPLLRDSSREVCLAAARAAHSCASPAISDVLLDILPRRYAIKPVVRALIAIGPPATEAVADRLRNPETPRLARLNLPRVLHGIGTREAFDVLMSMIEDADEGVRQKALASASRLRQALGLPHVRADRVQPIIQRELHDQITLREAWIRARPWLARPLCDAQIRSELRAGIVRIMRCCELAFSRTYVSAARAAIFSTDPVRRATALEMLDNVLGTEHRNAIVSATDAFSSRCSFDDQPPTHDTDPPDDVIAWFQDRIRIPGHYRRSLLFEAIGVRRTRRLASHAQRYVTSDNPFMRECALIALAACKVDGWQQTAERIAASDDHPAVRDYAVYVRDTGSAGLDPEDDMYTTVEKILFLQGVPLFSGVAGNELMPLALSSEVMRLPAGTTLFEEGQPGGALYVVIHGKVAVRQAGREVAVLGAGEVVGEMAILDEAPRSASAVVTEDADLLCVSAEAFHDAIQETTDFADGVIRVLTQRLRQQTNAAAAVSTDDQGRKTVA